jgi:chemotaxis signal transduction protein
MASERQGAFELLLEMDRRSSERRVHAEEQLKESGRWQYIRYRVADSLFVTSIADVSEILPLGKITPVPFTQHWIKGVTNIRGDVYVVTDFSRFLFDRPLSSGKKNKLIVLKGNSHSALLVDEIIGMTDVRQDEISDDVGDAQGNVRQLVGGSLDKDGNRYFVLDAQDLLSETNFIHAAIS